MLSGDNSILKKATDAKISSEKAETKEQARIDIIAWITDKTANHEDASLDDNIVKGILDKKSYVKEAKDASFITVKGEYEIPYSELYTASDTTKTIKFYLQASGGTSDPLEVEVEKGATWSDWAFEIDKDQHGIPTFRYNGDVIEQLKYGVYKSGYQYNNKLKGNFQTVSGGFMYYEYVITGQNPSVRGSDDSEITVTDLIESGKTYYYFSNWYTI